MTKRRFVLFAMAAVTVAVIGTLGLMLAGDLYLHRRFSEFAGLNAWGYRGPIAGRKQPDEWRIAFLGESTAFGYGVRWWEAIPALLQERLNREPGGGRRVSVVNLAYNNEGAHSYPYTLRDYDYLDYDAVVLYSGYNDLGSNTEVFRHNSVIFRKTGYMPIFPLIFREKAMVIRWNGALEDAYWGRKTTFKPNLAQRATATALETAANVSRSLDRQFAFDGATKQEDGHVDDAGFTEGRECGNEFGHYCGEMYLAIKFALDRGKTVLMASQPWMNERHRTQQALLRTFLDRRFGGNPRLRFASMGDVLDLKDRSLAYDGMHLTLAGNELIAAGLEPHARGMIR